MRRSPRAISTHTPLAGRDFNSIWLTFIFIISTHTPLAGRDRPDYNVVLHNVHFNSHAPCGARPLSDLYFSDCPIISTHTPLAGRDTAIKFLSPEREISTHTPLAGRDFRRKR